MSDQVNQSLSGIHLSLLMNLEAKFRDAENRLLGENKVPFEFHTDAPMELVECPYVGSRHKHFKPMNISALKQINSHWSEILNGFSCLRSFLLSQKTESKITVLDLYNLSIAGYLMPSYLFYRAKDAFTDGELPAFVATIYKASLGLINAVQVMLTKRLVLGRYNAEMQIDAEAFYLFAETEKLFIGPWEVCAGTPNQIKELLKVMLSDKIDKTAQISLIDNLSDYFHYITQAEKVVLLDNFFPFIFYFSLENKNMDKLLQILYEQDTLGFRGVSMELQFFDLIEPILGKKDANYQEKVKADLINIFEHIDKQNDIVFLLTQTEEEKEKFTIYQQKVFEFFASDEIRISRKLTHQDMEIVVEFFVSYLMLEQKKLALYTKYQREMNKVLGRDQVSRPIDGLDLTLMYDKKLRDVFASFLAVEIENFADKTILRQGVNTLVLE
ncbi:MAG: hypothetical protein JNM06_09675 [Blastocatellia bacterium]|nr:hypothetical protein [Blastocatellia bacterium]MBN8723933.1 hypothetical protein [Acidobacteriota bacterium]